MASDSSIRTRWLRPRPAAHSEGVHLPQERARGFSFCMFPPHTHTHLSVVRLKRFCCWSGLRPRVKKQLGVYLHSITQAQGRKKVCHCHRPFGHWCLQGYGGKGRARQAGSGTLTPISSRVSVIGETDPAGIWLSLTPGALPPPRPTGCLPKSLLHVQRIFCLVKRLPRISQQRLGNGVCFPAFSGNGFGSEQGAQLGWHPPPPLGRPDCSCRLCWGAGVYGRF